MIMACRCSTRTIVGAIASGARKCDRSPTSRSNWSRTSPSRRSSPSRTRGCSSELRESLRATDGDRRRAQGHQPLDRRTADRCSTPWSSPRRNCATRDIGALSARMANDLLSVAATYDFAAKVSLLVQGQSSDDAEPGDIAGRAMLDRRRRPYSGCPRRLPSIKARKPKRRRLPSLSRRAA